MKRVQLKMKDIMLKHKVSQSQLSLMSGVRQAAISEMVRNNRRQVSLDHLDRIVNALDIEEINEIFEIITEEEPIETME